MKKILLACFFIGFLSATNCYRLNAQNGVSFKHPENRIASISSSPLIVGPTSYWTGGSTPSCLYPNYYTDSILVTIPAGINISGLYVDFAYVTSTIGGGIPLSDGLFYISTICGQTDTLSCVEDTAGVCYLLPGNDFHSMLTPCFTPSCNAESFWLYAHLSRFHGGVGCDTGMVWYSATAYADSQYHFSAYVEGTSILNIAKTSTPDHGPCNGTAKVYPTGGTAPYTYLWSPNNQTTDSIGAQCFGTYCCTITDNKGCTDSVCVVISKSTGINTIVEPTTAVYLYPNPNNGIFTISLSHLELVSGSQTIVEIYNVLGENVLTETLRSTQGQNLIDIRNRPNGIYFYSVLNENGALVGEGKFVIQK